jgi:hypothetical protein
LVLQHTNITNNAFQKGNQNENPTTRIQTIQETTLLEFSSCLNYINNINYIIIMDEFAKLIYDELVNILRLPLEELNGG